MFGLPVHVNICFSVLFLACLDPCASCKTNVRWQRIPGGLIRVSVGPAGVWGFNRGGRIYHFVGTYGSSGNGGNRWTRIDGGNLRDLDVGDDVVWGTTAQGNLTCRQGINENTVTGTSWKILNTTARDVAISSRGQLVGINTNGEFFYREGLSSECSQQGKWITVTNSSHSLRKISVGASGIWAVDVDKKMYYRPGSIGNTGNIGTEWKEVNGVELTSLSVGTFFVIGVNAQQEIWRRDGVTESTPGGSKWVRLPGAAVDVDTTDYVCLAWAVNSHHSIYRGIF